MGWGSMESSMGGGSEESGVEEYARKDCGMNGLWRIHAAERGENG
jgi:hypothetical protein